MEEMSHVAATMWMVQTMYGCYLCTACRGWPIHEEVVPGSELLVPLQKHTHGSLEGDDPI
jgi:hypothetical protein